MTEETPEKNESTEQSSAGANTPQPADETQAAPEGQPPTDSSAPTAGGPEGETAAATPETAAATPETTAATPETTAAAPETTAATPETSASPGDVPSSDADAPASASSDSDEAAAAEGMPELTLGAGAPAEEPAAAVVEHVIRGKVDRFGVAIGTGRRKTSVARVRIQDGSGKLLINGRTLDEYFKTERDRNLVEAPLKATNSFGHMDVWVRVRGGGTTGQTGAIVLGIARALQAKHPALHDPLSEGGFLTRDGRMVERKKYGFKKARKSFQFSKR